VAHGTVGLIFNYVRDTYMTPVSSREETEKPPSSGDHPQWLVAVIANVKEQTHHQGNGPEDSDAEFDKPETIQNIRNAIEYDGHRTVFVQANAELPFTLRKVHPDICFNIAEGSGSDAREAQVPALLALMGIPYTASMVLANAVSLDKPLTKRLWRGTSLPITPYQVFSTGDEPLRKDLSYPLFVKPVMEGTGMGVGKDARVNSDDELRKRVNWVIETYHEPALVETFLSGREFTIGVLGRPDAHRYARRPELFGKDGFHRFPVLEIESMRSATPGIYSHEAKSKAIDEVGAPGYLCPADIDPHLALRLHHLAVKAHKSIGALDVSRVDIRMSADGKPYLLEINTLPGLNPAISDLCIMSDAEGLTYRDLILEILYLGASRYGMLKPRN
jgi:D-alanine-D-alanine ligase